MNQKGKIKDLIMSMPIWNIGFRPFFMLGTVSGVVTLTLWLLAFDGIFTNSYLNSFWHGHEMIFGFGLAVVVGFLLTASQNWSGKRGLHGSKLMTLTIVWLLGRLIIPLGPLSALLGAVVDLTFLPLVVLFLYPYFSSKEQRKNRGFILILTSLWLCDLCYQGFSLGYLEDYRRKALLVAVQFVIVIVVVISGRVLPFFSRNAVPNYHQRNFKNLNSAAIFVSILFLLTYSYLEIGELTYWVGIAAGLVHLARFCVWFDKGIIFKPVLWILYVGYLWIIVGYFASSLAAAGLIMPSLATHAFTAGVISVMIIGMMTRVTRGHTGRPILATRTTTITYVFIIVASILRFGAPLVLPASYVQLIIVSGVFWVAAASLFLLEYMPMLVSPRSDGRPG